MAKSPGSCQHCYQRGEREREREGETGSEAETARRDPPPCLAWMMALHTSLVSLFPALQSLHVSWTRPRPTARRHTPCFTSVSCCARCDGVCLSLCQLSQWADVSSYVPISSKEAFLIPSRVTSSFVCAFCFNYRELPWACDSD